MNWKEKFNKEFKNSFNVGVVPDDMTKAKIETFISNLLKEIKAEAMGERAILHKECGDGKYELCEECLQKESWNAHRERTRKVFDKLIN